MKLASTILAGLASLNGKIDSFLDTKTKFNLQRQQLPVQMARSCSRSLVQLLTVSISKSMTPVESRTFHRLTLQIRSFGVILVSPKWMTTQLILLQVLSLVVH